MTICKECGRDLAGLETRAEYDDTLLSFLMGRAKPGDPMPKPGEPGYTEKQGFLLCGCGRKIPISAKMFHNPKEYDEL